MSRVLTKIITMIVLIIASSFLFACGANDLTENESTAIDGKNNLTESNNSKTLYTDSDAIEYEDFSIKLKQVSCNESNNYTLSVTINLTNIKNSTKEYNIKNASIIKESSGAIYSVTYTSRITLDAELNGDIVFRSTIPSSIREEIYTLNFKINNYNITCRLCEMPDEYRQDRKVNYYIDNKLVRTDTVKDKRKIETKYIYESNDGLYYCDTWYSNENKTTQFNFSTAITSDVNLYGNKLSNYTWATTSTDTYSFLNGINHIPSNGVLIIPQKHANKELCIGINAITNINVTKIYLPKTVHTIYYGNFKNINNATIYFEGTEDEWRAAFSFSTDIVTTNVVYNTKYQG